VDVTKAPGADMVFWFATTDPVQQAEEILKSLRDAKNEKARQSAVQELEKVLQAMKAHHPKKADLPVNP
jgi:hypothetical protein